MLKTETNKSFNFGLFRFVFKRGNYVCVGFVIEFKADIRCVRPIVTLLRRFFAFDASHNLSGNWGGCPPNCFNFLFP